MKRDNVRFVFGIPGGQLCPILDGIRRLGQEAGLQFVTTRHEQAAAHMTDATARVTGQPGVCIGTVGPGAADLVPGVYAAWADSIPVVVLTAQNQSWKSYPERGSMQSLDQIGLFEPITRWSAQVTHWERIPELVQRAFRVAVSGRPRPVHLDLHGDVLVATGDESSLSFRPVLPEKYRPDRGPVAQPELIERAARMLVEAERPLIHPGGGVLRSGAWDEVRELAEHLSAPVTTSQGACGVLPEDHPLCLIPDRYGALGAQAMADLVLLVGGRLGDVALLGDARATLRILVEAVKRLGAPVPERVEMVEYRAAQDAWLAQFQEQAALDQTPIHPLRLMRDVRAFFPRPSEWFTRFAETERWA